MDLPDWAPGHRVKSSEHRGDVDVPDWAPGHPSSRTGAHPSSQQERGQGYQRNQDVSPPPDARHDMAARCVPANLMAGSIITKLDCGIPRQLVLPIGQASHAWLHQMQRAGA